MRKNPIKCTGFPYGKNRGALHFVAHGQRNWLPVGCPWNFAMRIRLPTTSIYGNSGQLSGQQSGLPMGILPCKLGCPLLPYMETVGSSVGCPLAIRLPTSSMYGNMGQLSRQRSELPMGILSYKLSCPLLPYMNTVGSSVDNSVAALYIQEW